ncbi:MAG TPA: ABC transporter ATP-binding protein [Polyangia bacterium]|jgi:lipoprotein-releasing system ATP-binding protein
MSGARVEIRQLRKSYDHGGQKLEVLRGIDLMIGAGEMVAVVGSSGAGKSTLLHLLGTLDQPTAGAVFYDGVEVTRMPPAAMADFRNRTIGFVFQFHHLLPEFTAVENCAMPALIAGLGRDEANARAMKLLIRVGLQKRVTHRPGELSGGEQQRVALARALVMEPRVLLADEPTGNLDTATGEEMHSLVVELNRDLGMTLVVVTHNPEFARRLPRRVHMVDGMISDEPSIVGHA